MTITLDLRPYVQMSDAQFFDFCARHKDLRIERNATGEIAITPPVGGDSGNRNIKLSTRINLWSEASGLGEAFDSSTGFILPNGAQRSPDTAWVERSRWEALTAEQRSQFPPLCPDFVAELVSPSDSVPELRAKMREFIENGARLGWLINPRQRQVEIYRPGRPAETLDDPGSLSGEDVLPGLTLDLKGIL